MNTVAADGARAAVLPLTYGQDHEVCWALGRDQPSNAIQIAVRVDGPLDVDQFEHALRHVVRHNDGLRMRPLADTPDGASALGQSAAPADDPSGAPLLARQMVKARDEEQFTDYVGRTRTSAKRRAWDLVQGPPYAFRVLRLASDHHAFLADFSRFAIDGRGRTLFISRLWEAYVALAQGREPGAETAPDAFAQAARRQRAAMDARSGTVNAAYWRKRYAALFEGQQAMAGSPDANGREAQTSACLPRQVRIAGQERIDLRSAHDGVGATVFQWVLAACAVEAFERWPDLVLEVVCQMDTRASDAMGVLGRFTLKLPLLLKRSDDFGAVLGAIKTDVLQTMRHRHVTRADLARARDEAAASVRPGLADAGPSTGRRIAVRLMDHGDHSEEAGLLAVGLRQSDAYPTSVGFLCEGIDLAVHVNPSRIVINLFLDPREFDDRDADEFAAALDARLRDEARGAAAARATAADSPWRSSGDRA